MGAQQYKLGFILPNDLVKREPFGGISGFVESVLPYIHAPVVIYGLAINGTPTWKPFRLAQNTVFIAISDMKYPSRVPMRIKALFSYMRHRKRILSSDIDVLYVHSPECALPFLFFNSKVPIIYHQHGSGNPMSRATYVWARRRIFQKLFDFINFLIHRRSDWIIAIDEKCVKQAEQNGASTKLSLIMNAVNTKKFFPNHGEREFMRKKYEIEDSETVILFVGRIEEAKRVDRILEAVKRLSFDGFRCRLFLAGDGTLRNDMESFVNRNTLQKSITFLGRLYDTELPSYYNMADMLALPSTGEGIPMAMLEALGCGTPIVASNVGGIGSIVINGRNGILLENANPLYLAEALKRLSNHEISRESIAESVSHLSSEKFAVSLDKIVSKVLSKQ